MEIADQLMSRVMRRLQEASIEFIAYRQQRRIVVDEAIIDFVSLSQPVEKRTGVRGYGNFWDSSVEWYRQELREEIKELEFRQRHNI